MKQYAVIIYTMSIVTTSMTLVLFLLGFQLHWWYVVWLLIFQIGTSVIQLARWTV